MITTYRIHSYIRDLMAGEDGDRVSLNYDKCLVTSTYMSDVLLSTYFTLRYLREIYMIVESPSFTISNVLSPISKEITSGAN